MSSTGANPQPPPSEPAAGRADGGLPIDGVRAELLGLIEAHQVLIVAGETGSGKSTQLPQLCLQAGRGADRMIAHTQPRRVAARTIAARIAEELGPAGARLVAYSVRFDDRVRDETRLRVMTDGLLLAELQNDPDLLRYDTIIVDEAHERSLNIDFLLGYLHGLLERRTDLKLLITSATIDTARFAEHFSTASRTVPVIEIPGQRYPVEIGYRPVTEDGGTAHGREQILAVVEATEELLSAGPGDILVFVSGEREIRDTAEALRGRFGAAGDIEVLPLYARLSGSEQQRVFAEHRGRRIIVSTNVAETSITVPGVRYVVDTGLARVSRFSRRLKVQRLPIEEISQASADQRAGRCGRLGPGICLRLYSEESYQLRPEFTEPEILRTNLASVILQMASLGLGEVTSFPFLEPPDASSWRDGRRLLIELGALTEEAELTPLGRRLARLPVDPRLGRMIIEADRLDCVHDVLVVAAALSIRDPRERPLEERAAADASHARFAVPGSDVMTLIALWDHVRRHRREMSGQRFRRLCREEYLSAARVREWEDLFSQLRRAAGQIGIRCSANSPDEHHDRADRVHRAVLAGHLSHLGRRDDRRGDYEGALQSRFQIAGGSSVRSSPRWVVAVELVETDRLRARTVAAVRPEWAEELGAHLLRHRYGEVMWDPRQRRAVVDESVSLFGLSLVEGRRIGAERIDTALARSMMLRHLVVDPILDESEPSAADGTLPAFVERNRAVIARRRRLADRLRRHDIVSEAAVFDFFDRRIPHSVTTGTRLDRWWRRHSTRLEDELDLGTELLGPIASADEWATTYPDLWRQADLELDLRYRFEPGTPLDGISVVVPLALVDRVDAAGFDWQIPGYRDELVVAYLRGLPKAIRRRMIPFAETVERVVEAIAAHRSDIAETAPRDERLCAAVAAALSEIIDVRIPAETIAAVSIPEHLQVTFIVVDAAGEVRDVGRDLDALRARLGTAVQRELATFVPVLEQRGAVDWVFGTIEPMIEYDLGVAGDGGAPGAALGARASRHQTVRAYPGLVDDGDSVSLRIFGDEASRLRSMRAGVRRLLVLANEPLVGRTVAAVGRTAVLAVASSGFGLDELARDSLEAAVERLMAASPLPFDAEAYARLRRAIADDLAVLTADALDAAIGIVALASQLGDRVAAMLAPGLAMTAADVTDHLERLVPPRFVVRAGTRRLPEIARYLRGIEYRLDRLGGHIERDRARMAEIQPLEERFRRLRRDGRGDVEAIDEFAWQLEELRMAVFAQQLGVVGAPSITRLTRALDRLID